MTAAKDYLKKNPVNGFYDRYSASGFSKKCPGCFGTGKVTRVRPRNNKTIVEAVPCSRCDGVSMVYVPTRSLGIRKHKDTSP